LTQLTQCEDASEVGAAGGKGLLPDGAVR
jgi:hypothetical protein